MNDTIEHQTSGALAVVTMESNKTIKVKPAAMVSRSDGLTNETKSNS